MATSNSTSIYTCLTDVTLGHLYFEGKGVPQDYVTAYMWLNLAAARSPEMEPNAAKARELVASRMTRAQIAQGQKLTRQWVPR